MAGILDSLGQILLPKGKGVKNGRGFTPDFNPRTPAITAPLYKDHLTDIYTSRVANDSRSLIATLLNMDPDMSAALHAFLTIAESTDPIVYAFGPDDQIDPEGIALGQQLLALVTTTNDYTLGYSAKPTVDALCSDHRYTILARGMTSMELVLDKTYLPSEFRLIDPATLEWAQKANGAYLPTQKPAGANTTIDLNIPTFFTSYFHQSPFSKYSYSPFVAAINTIAARQAVINDLYRIMQIVGYPRLDVKVLEEVLTANAPPAFRTDQAKIRSHVENELNRVRAAISSLNASDAFVHSNAVEASILNEKNPAAGLQITEVIEVLNAQNQASLKVMPAVVGKGGNGQVASTEARLFALSADALNRSVAGILSKSLTLAARLSGYEGRIEVLFEPVELRPQLELEPQKTMRSARLKQDLSLGLITDIEYSMAMYGRPPLAGAPTLSGTNFMPSTNVQVEAATVSSESDSLGRGLSGEGGNGVAKDNKAKGGGGGASSPSSRSK
ncbi:MAG: hypothetical protein ABW128_22740 [Rhizorhabdus sp.]